MTTLRDQFGDIDIYVFDQLLRGRIAPGHRILDAGCGGGRNLVYLLRQGFDVWAVDQAPEAVATVRALRVWHGRSDDADRVRLEPLDRLSFADETFDVVICTAVLHFARDDAHFEAMVGELWRVLKPGGLLVARLASTLGVDRLVPLGHHRFALPDGSKRYLVSPERLLGLTARLGGRLVDPLKTTGVHDLRAMSTWVASKAPDHPTGVSPPGGVSS
jgi:SAM-dependent methyltransferase